MRRKACICDVDGSGSITATDALLLLKIAVGYPVPLACNCPPQGIACTSAVFESRLESDLDSGWTGIAHNSELILGASISFRSLRRRSDNQEPCEVDGDCASNDCVPTCNCMDDTSCEINGPTHAKNCLTTLKDCTTNAECPTGVACVSMFGPPLPLSACGTPVCVISLFDGPLTGTADSATGSAETSSSLKSRVFLGITIDKPCPRCGDPEENPQIGDTFACSGGQFPNAACTVDGVSPVFGGTSYDCPPALSANQSGAACRSASSRSPPEPPRGQHNSRAATRCSVPTRSTLQRTRSVSTRSAPLTRCARATPTAGAAPATRPSLARATQIARATAPAPRLRISR